MLAQSFNPPHGVTHIMGQCDAMLIIIASKQTHQQLVTGVKEVKRCFKI